MEQPYPEERMQRQQDEILRYMRANGINEASPGDLFSAGVLSGSPLTSYRRSLTNMTTAGVMQKTSKTKKGLFGRMEHIWKILDESEA